MIRGKGFEFSTLIAFQNILNSEIWEVSKPNMNAQAMQHDVDILVKHIPSAKTISVDEYADHMSLSLAQLETVTLMLTVLDQPNGGTTPTE